MSGVHACLEPFWLKLDVFKMPPNQSGSSWVSYGRSPFGPGAETAAQPHGAEAPGGNVVATADAPRDAATDVHAETLGGEIIGDVTSHKQRRGENEVTKLYCMSLGALAHGIPGCPPTTPAAAHANSLPEGVNAEPLCSLRSPSLPVELAVELEGWIAAAVSQGEPVSLDSVICTAKHLCGIYNQKAQKEHEATCAINLATFIAFTEGKISSDEFVRRRRHIKIPKFASLKLNKSWARRFLRARGWKTTAVRCMTVSSAPGQ